MKVVKNNAIQMKNEMKLAGHIPPYFLKETGICRFPIIETV